MKADECIIFSIFTSMNDAVSKISFRWLQVLLWIIFFLAWALYTNNKWNDNTYGFASTLVSILFYIIAVYGNSLWLMPRLFKKGKIIVYLLYSLLFLAVLIIVRAWIENLLLMPMHKRFYDLRIPHLSLVFLTTLVAYLFGSFLFVARNYIGLLKKQEEMRTQQSVTELNLLKQQVQPHFLFNTLNNIYSLANARSENTKLAIAKLADIMRYFMEDAPKEKLGLQKEIEFINNYISLEQLRLLYPLKMQTSYVKDHVDIPPMLLMPFVENLFKHGVDKTRSDNKATLALAIERDRLMYTVTNKLSEQSHREGGFGLSNLKKRLDLLYGNNYTLRTSASNGFFNAYMEIPL